MEKLKQQRFRANDWAQPSQIVEGTLKAIDKITLESTPGRNENGYVLCLEDGDDCHIIDPETLDPI